MANEGTSRALTNIAGPGDFFAFEQRARAVGVLQRAQVWPHVAGDLAEAAGREQIEEPRTAAGDGERGARQRDRPKAIDDRIFEEDKVHGCFQANACVKCTLRRRTRGPAIARRKPCFAT